MSYRRILQALLACTLCLGFGTAGAEPLTITSGSFVFSPTLGVGGASGDGFSISFLDQGGFRVGVVFLGLENSSCCLGQVIVGPDICRFGFTSDVCGILRLTSSIPLFNPAPGEPFTPDPFPFTAEGHLNVGPGYDVVGQGSVTAMFCNVPTDCTGRNFPPDRIFYTFSVPEPPTFLVFLAGFGLVLTLRILGPYRTVLSIFDLRKRLGSIYVK